MQPSEEEKFYPSQVKAIAEQVLKEGLDGEGVDGKLVEVSSEDLRRLHKKSQKRRITRSLGSALLLSLSASLPQRCPPSSALFVVVMHIPPFEAHLFKLW